MTAGQSVPGLDAGRRAEIADAVQRAHHDYVFGLDLRDPDRFVSAWHADAIWDLSIPGLLDVRRGHADILAGVQGMWAQQSAITHITGDHQLDIRSAELACGVGHASAVGVAKDGRGFVLGALYPDDVYEQRNGVWRLARRTVTMTMMAFFPHGSEVLLFDHHRHQ